MSTVLSGLSVFVQIAVFSLSLSGNSNSLETIMLYEVASMLIDVNYSKFPKTDIWKTSEASTSKNQST